ncbi:MAG TPA: IS630 family transposase [Rhodanobacter sp.]|nr:IS630 family transposase [Rhodanobacter sp.]
MRDLGCRAGRGGERLGAAARARPRHDHAQKKSLIATERDEVARAAWREAVGALDPADLIFLDETATHIAMTPRYARAPRGVRVHATVPRNDGQTTTLLAALSGAGVGPAMTLDGAADGPAFVAYVRAFLAPTLRPGQVVILDNLSVHKVAAARALVEARGCQLLFLPAYSPDLNPIELAFAKLKEALRRAEARTRAALEAALAAALAAITASDAHGWFAACGYPLQEAQPLC